MNKKLRILFHLFINRYLKRKTAAKNYLAIKIRHRKKINPQFRSVIKTVRSEYLELQNTLDAADQRGENFQSLMSQYYPRMEKITRLMIDETNHLANNFSDREHLSHKDFFRDQLSTFLLSSPFTHRALMKPRGYAGDYRMMDMMYTDNPFMGETSFGKMLQSATYHLASGRAVHERIRYSTEKMNIIGKQIVNQGRNFSVLNLACGSAADVQAFIRSSPSSEANQTEVHLVDQDTEALQIAQDRMDHAIEETKSKIKTYFYPMDIQKILGADHIKTLPKFDLIYSGGLFDYLDDTVFSFVLAKLFDRLNPEGFIIIGNFSVTDNSKIVRWYLSDWPLIYRTPKDLKRIAAVLSKPKQIRIESDESGIVLYLTVQK